MERQEYKPIRNFIINGMGKWVQFPLTSSEIDEIAKSVGLPAEEIKFTTSVEKYYLDEAYGKAIHYALDKMDIHLMNNFALSVKEYVETGQKNDLFKKLELECYVKIDNASTTYSL